MITLNTLKPAKGSTHSRKRIGRGHGSGQGTQAGKGHKGQKARAGAHIRIGFEGGTTPLYRRLPKRRLFTNIRFKKNFSIVHLAQLAERFEDGATISPESVVLAGLVKGQEKNYPVKVLIKNAEDVLSKKFHFEGISAFSQKAKDLVVTAGGSIK